MSFAGTSTGCLLLLALAGCVSSDASLSARNLDQAGVTAGSSALALKEDAPSTGKAKPETKAAAADTKKDAEEVAASAPALAMAAKAPQSPALAAANSAIADTGVAVPTPSPNDDADNTQPAATSQSATAGTDEASSPVETASAAAQPSEAGDAAAEAEQKQGFSLLHLFSSNQAGRQAQSGHSMSSRGSTTAPAEAEQTQAKQTAASADDVDPPNAEEPDPIEVASIDDEHDEYEPMDALPGVRLQSLYSFSESGDADGRARIQLASAAGMARLPSGSLVKQREAVQTACLKPALVGLLKRIQYHYDAPVMITSGYRGKKYNRRVGGVRRSKHLSCEAADIQVEGVSKWQLAKYVRSIPGRGGVGTYCHTNSVHVDIGKQRDWNWRCRRGK